MSFILSKILWKTLTPGNLLILIAVIGGLASYAKSPKIQSFGRNASVTATSILLIIGLFPVDQWTMAPLENRFKPTLPQRTEGILLLGGDEDPRRSELRGQPIANLSMQRYMIFADLAHRYPDAKLVYVGGSGNLLPNTSSPDTYMKEADVARKALAEMGVSTERMRFETESRNTHENAVFAARLVHPEPEQTWVLVTNAFHMPRAVACFRAAGWNISPYPAGYFSDGDLSPVPNFSLTYNLFAFSLAIHEYIGLMAYRLLGYTDSLWPN